MTPGSQAFIDEQNPWPGLGAFDEGSHRFFNGRRTEAVELRRLVLHSPVTLLFGASGLGKTSLVQAGLFPLLRKDHLLPIYVRLDVRNRQAPLIWQVQAALKDELQAHGIDAPTFDAGETLWQYLHRHKLEMWSRQNQLLSPLFVFDQFEEMFTLGLENVAAITALRIDLADLIENRIPAALTQAANEDERLGTGLSLDTQRYKVLLSFREDFLPAVEGWKHDLPSLQRNRLRLLPMSGEQAFEAVHTTASYLVDEALARRIVDFVAAAQDEGAGHTQAGADGRELEVEPALLSVVCRGLNDKRKAQGSSKFDDALLSGSGQTIISDYYREAVRDVPESIRRFIENELITERGFRKTCDLDDARSLHGVSDRDLRLLVDRRLLRIEPWRGTERIELTHDLLTRVVREHRDRQRVRRQRKRVVAVAAVVLAGMAFAFVSQSRYAESQRRKAIEQTHLREDAVNARNQAEIQKGLTVIALGKTEEALKQARKSAEAEKKERGLAEEQRRRAEQAARTAEIARRDAEQQAKISTSGRLATAAQLEKASRLDLASLLNVEAIKAADTFESRNALLSTLQFNPRLLTFFRPVGGVKNVVFSPDGKMLAWASGAGPVQLWDVATRQPMEQLPGSRGNSTFLAFSPDGRVLASASDRAVRLWDVEGRQVLTDLPTEEPVWAVAFSPDAKILATATSGDGVRLWDVASRQPLGEPLKASREQYSLAFSPNGAILASAGADYGSIRLWDVATAQRFGETLSGTADSIRSLAFSPDGALLASVGLNYGVRLWNVTSRRLVWEPYKWNEAIVQSVAFSPDGKTLAAAGRDAVVRLWDLSHEPPQALGEPLTGNSSAVDSVFFSPDGRMLVAAGQDQTIRLWDVADGRALKGHQDEVTLVAFSPDGRMLFSASRDNTIRLWDVASRDAVQYPTLGQPVQRSLRTGKAGLGRNPSVEALSPDGKILASAAGNNTIQLWNVISRELIGEPLKVVPVGVLYGLAFSPDGTILASASTSATCLWDVASRKALGDPLKPGAYAVAFSPDGKTLAAGPQLWNVASRQPMGAPLDVHGNVWTVAFSPDGKLVSASEDNIVRLWEVASRQPFGEPLHGHGALVLGVTFSPDGKILASASRDKTVRLWDVATQRPLGEPLQGHERDVKSIAFSPDGKILASASADRTIRLWDGNNAAWAARLCRLANRNLSFVEWQRYIGRDVPYRRTCPDLADGEGVPGDHGAMGPRVR